ncbi:MAG: efflux RND transporter periplasmic adaptor subunit [Burkholderiales bacterium]
MIATSSPRNVRYARVGLALLLAVTLVAGCKKEEHKAEERPPVEVTVLELAPRDTPVSFEFVGQTQSTRQVQIVARVSGFLDKRVYTEGSFVKSGQVMFLQDPKPFKAQLDAAKGELAEQKARLDVARDNLARVKPLAARKALSQRELDDATGQFLAASAAVETAKANVEQAQLNLGYTTITTPVSGLSSFAKVQDGQYLSGTGESSVLTYVAQTDPIWVNFSISENDMLTARQEQARGLLRMPANEAFEVEVILADGSVFPKRGRITFTNADYNTQTGTFLLRATVPNPGAALRPGQFVRVRILGAVRPNAILVPQQAVLQGAKGHFVVIVDKENKAEIRPVEVGPWHGNDWFITRGLSPGETVIIDGMVHLSPGATVKIVATKTETESSGPGPGSAAGTPEARALATSVAGAAGASTDAQQTSPLPAKLYFAVGSARLDADATAAVANAAAYLAAHPDATVDVTGFADKTGQHAKNVVLAKERAKTVRNTLFDQGVKATQVTLKPPADVTGGPDDQAARRVEISSAAAGGSAVVGNVQMKK